MGTYLTTAVRDELERAQAEMDEHLRLTVTGCCAACGEVAPCQRRNELSGSSPSTGRCRSGGRAWRARISCDGSQHRPRNGHEPH